MSRKKLCIGFGVAIVIGIAVVVCAVLFMTPADDAVPPALSLSLELYGGVLESIFNTMADDFINTASSLSTIPFDGEEALMGMNNLYARYTWTVGVVLCDEKGEVVQSSPVSDSSTSGAFTPPVLTADDFEGKRALLTSANSTEWNGYICSIAVPVYGPDGTYRGYLSVGTQPHYFVRQIVEEMQIDFPYQAEFLCDDGTIWYSSKSELIGKNIYRDNIGKPETWKNDISVVFSKERGSFVTHQYEQISSRLVEVVGVWKRVTIYGEEYILIMMEQTTPAYPVGSSSAQVYPSELFSIVGEVYSYARTHSQEETLEFISQIDTGNIDVFAHNMDGDVLASSLVSEKVGQNMMNTLDAYGIHMVRMLTLRAEQGAGYVYFYYPTSEKILPDSGMLTGAYVQMINSSWYVGAAATVSPDVIPVHSSNKDVLKNTIEDILSYAANAEQAETLSLIQQKNISVNGVEIDIFAVDYDGKILAYNSNVSRVGTDLFSLTDVSGASIPRDMVMSAKTGGGYVYYRTGNKETGIVDVSLLYVKPGGSDWLVGAGILLNSFDENGKLLN